MTYGVRVSEQFGSVEHPAAAGCESLKSFEFSRDRRLAHQIPFEDRLIRPIEVDAHVSLSVAGERRFPAVPDGNRLTVCERPAAAVPAKNQRAKFVAVAR